MENDYQHCKLTIHKSCEDGHDISGVGFELYIWNTTTEEWDLYETGYTDDTGYVTFEDLPFGDYRVYEIGQLDDDGNLTTPRCKMRYGSEYVG